MDEINKIKKCILCISLFIALLSFTTYFISWTQNKDQTRASTTSTTSPFFIAHVLDPDVDGYQFTSWRRQHWIAWLNRREILHQRSSPNRKTPLNQKGLNSVLIASRSEILNAFENQRYPYNSDSSSRDRMFWSESIFHSFIFQRQGNTYRVFKCPPMYIAVKLVNGMPVHLHEHSKRREMRSYKVKLSKDCIEII